MQLLLVRHAPVVEKYAGVCYGQSDVELSDSGRQRSEVLASELAALPVTYLLHSGLIRTKFLAERIAEHTGIEPTCCPWLQERDFGAWELQTWDALYQQTGDQMLQMVSQPAEYRPGGGETTFEMRDRVLTGLRRMSKSGLGIAVTHGGPIAAIRGTCARIPVSDWPALIPPCGEYIAIETDDLA